jgi:hypothetical protein
MKSSVLIFLSLLLATAILAPSIITLVDIENKTEILMDFNEEEKKEEKKETSEKDLLFITDFNAISSQQKEKIRISKLYFEGNYATCVTIFLHPPQSYI